MSGRDRSEQFSAVTALLLTAALAALAIVRIDFVVPQPPDEPDITIAMEDPAPEAPTPDAQAPAASPAPSSEPEQPPPPEPPPPEPPPPEPPPPEPPAPVAPLPPVAPPPPVVPPPPVQPLRPVPPRPVPPRPVRQAPTRPPTPRPALRSSPAPQAPAAPAAEAPAKPVPSGPPPSASASLEAGFVGRLRTYIRSITRYPTSKEARLLHPGGSVEVGFTLSRAGAVGDVGLIKTSGSSVLDQAALAIVRGGTYPGMPDTAWSGEASHRFTVTVEFLPT